MGGNALPRANTRRYNRDEYLLLSKEITSVLTSLFAISDKDIEIIKSYHQKETFGDIDILIVAESLPQDYVLKLVNHLTLDIDEWTKDGNVVSFAYKECQVDLIITPEADFVTSQNYFAYNDLGNLLGRLFKRLGIKYGHSGLKLIVRSDHSVLAEILLTKDMREVCDLLQLDYDKFVRGFETLDDIFAYVTSSPYFHPDIFLLDNVNHTSRIRDRKRKTYNAFLDYCKDLDPAVYVNEFNQINAVKPLKYGYAIKEPYFSDLIVPRWPHVLPIVEATVAEYELNKSFKAVFNGLLVFEWTGLVAKELGGFMSNITKRVTATTKKLWIKNPQIPKVIVDNELNLDNEE